MNTSSSVRFLISNLETFRSKYSTTITLGLYLVRLKPLRTCSSWPSTSIESKSILKSLYFVFEIILSKVSVVIFFIDETFAFWNSLVFLSIVFIGDFL